MNRFKIAHADKREIRKDVTFTVQVKIVSVVRVTAYDEIEAEEKAIQSLGLTRSQVMHISDLHVRSSDPAYVCDTGWYKSDVDRLVDMKP